MILWFGKKKKKKDMLAEGAAMEAEGDALAPADDTSSGAELDVPPTGRDGGDGDGADQTGTPPSIGVAKLSPESRNPGASGPTSVTSLPGASADPQQTVIKSEQDYREPPAASPGEETDPSAARQEPEPEPDPASETTKPGFFRRLTQGLSRSSSKLADGITGVFTKRKLDDETLEELEDLLIASDLGTGVAARVTTNLARDRFDKEISDLEIKEALAKEIADVLSPRERVVDFSDGPSPRVVLFVGVNGSGKTTTIGKIASKLTEQGARALLVAGDTFRAAAIEQLTVWGERAAIPVMSKPTGADAAGLVFEAIERAKAEGLDLVLVDTAGRLQNKTELMSELAKIVRVTRKLDPDAPHDVILVLDATVGQNALSQVEAFRHTAGVTGLVMTKLDGTAKGGVLVAIADKHDLPIHFVGVGERAEDLQPFSASAFARALVGLES
ncbi:MAG: signal recognition particle-docking protein FtsY [Pseudomonadota bacterium]